MTIREPEQCLQYDQSFSSKLQEEGVNQYIISFENYANSVSEGSFIVMMRINKSIRHNSIGPFARSLSNTKMARHDSINFAHSTLNMPSEKKMEEERLAEFKNYFLLHQYQFIDQATQEKDILDEIKIYTSKYHISLAKFSGFEIKNPDNKKIPCIITERPVNGSLFSYYQTILNQTAFTETVELDKSTEFNTSSDSEDNFSLNMHFSNKIQELSLEEKYILIVGITAGIEFLHSLGLVHGRLNPHNIYLNEFLQAKICGYGFIKPKEIGENDDEKEGNSVYNIGLIDDLVFNSPEVLKEAGIYQLSDIYSLGALIYYILSEIEPFNNLKPLQKRMKICDGKLPSFPENINDQWSKLIISCCQKDPHDRPTARKILSRLLNDENHSNNLLSSLFGDSPQFSDEQVKYLSNIKNSIKFDVDIYESDIIVDCIPDETVLSAETKELIMKADHDDPDSLHKLAGYFLEGNQNLPKDEYMAFHFYSRAADLDHPQATKKVADGYYKGLGTKKDLHEALRFYRKALQLNPNEIDLQIITQNIQKIEEVINKSDDGIPDDDEGPDDDKPDDDKPDDDEGPDDPEAQKLRDQERKEKLQLRLKLTNLDSSTTDADISKVLMKYGTQNATIELKSSGCFDYAFISFECIEDKEIFINKYKKDSSIIRIRNRNIDVYENDTNKVNKIRSTKTKTTADLDQDENKRKYRRKKLQQPKMISRKEFEKRFHQQKKTQLGISPSKSSLIAEIDLKDYCPGEGKKAYDMIGEGVFGDVYKVYGVKDKKVYAAKVLKKGFSTLKERKYFYREIGILSAINHPLIIRLYGLNQYSLIDPKIKHATIITEYVPNKTVTYMIEKAISKLNNTMKLKIFIGVACAMAYLHSNRIIHRDLKPDNIFLDENYEPKIGDFGTSRKIDQSNELLLTANIGTPVYMAPELLSGEIVKYDYEVDVFSFGVTVYQIAMGKKAKEIYPKFKGNQYKLFKHIIAGNRPQIPPTMDNSLKELIQSCWSHKINDRQSFKLIFELFKETFLAEIPPTTFLPKVDVSEIKEYILKLDGYTSNL